MSRAWAAIGLAAGLSACVHYASAPVGPDSFPAAYAARRLDEKPPGALWTAAELLSVALARNPQIAEARAKYATARAVARGARSSPAMTLTLTAEYADEAPHWGGGAAADVPLDVGGRRATRLTTADLQALQAWYDYGEAIWAVRTALAKARVDLASARVEILLAERSAAFRRDRLERLLRRVWAGEDDQGQALTAQAELAAAERRGVDARGREAAAVIKLAKALGVSPDAARDLAVTEGQPASLDGLADWRRDAAASRSDVLRAIGDYDLAEAALRLEVVRQYPEIRIGPAYTYDHGVNKLPFNLSLALPPLDLNRSAIAQAEAARTAAGRSLERTQADALSAVDDAVVTLNAARANVERAMARDLPAARRMAEATARATRAGEIDRVDDLAAQAAAVDVELNLLDARRAAASATVDLEDALRRPFDPAETAVLQAALTQPGGAP